LLHSRKAVGFRLRENESVRKGLHRVVNKELRSASERLTLDSSDAAIHEARKSIKKVRAVLQLLGDDLDAGKARKHLRRASHLLSPLRDADAMLETTKTLRADAKMAKAVTALTSRLEAEKSRLRDEADAGRVRRKAAAALDRVRHDARDWQWKKADYPALVDAMKRSYKRAAKAMEDARSHDDPERFHNWRKRVKTHWYGLRLLSKRAPKLRQPIADFKRLETALGDDHNLLVLHEQVQSPHLRSVTERRQRALQQDALSVGRRVLAQRPKVFAKQLQEMWNSARRSSAGEAA
jgi:hypothetical protein